MSRSVVRLLAVAVAVAAAAAPASAGRDELQRAAASRLAALRTSLRADRSIFEKSVARHIADLNASRIGAEAAADEFQGSLTFLLGKVDAAVDAAAAGFVADAAALMDAELSPGANPGDGGTLDRFTESVRGELSRLRGRVQVRARAYGKAFIRFGRGNTSMNTVLPAWTFDLPAAPAPGGVVEAEDAPLQLRLVTAARLPDGRLVMTVAGNAARSYSGAFDLRLRSGVKEDLVGSPLSGGGISVGATGYWTRTVELGDPFRGDVPLPGNRVMHFGVEPSADIPPAGVQPQRLLHAGVFQLP